LPFEILPLDDGRYLLEEFRVSYVTTGRDLLEVGPVTRRQLASSVVVGDPDFDLGGVATRELPGLASQIPLHPEDLIPRLPGTLREAQRIAGLLGVTPLLGPEALTTKLKSCRSPLVLHIATHGYFIPDFYPMSNIDIYPSNIQLDDIRDLPQGRYNWFWSQLLHTSSSPFLRAGLLLAGFNTWLRGGDPPVEAEEGVLTAAEVLNMDLQETQLVVLSACDTGAGQVLNYEGVSGLRRAFMLAGAKALVMSLWKVPDQQTQELMINFYEHLVNGYSPADALHVAQITVKAVYPHPFYWGAFICQGDSTHSLSY
jgi:CHAT domain-containing protein